MGIGRKKKAGSGFCGCGARCALHSVRFESDGEEQHLHLKEMSWHLPAFKIEGHGGSAKSSRSTKKANSSADASFDGLENSPKQTFEPLPGGVPDTPSKYKTREGMKLGV